MAEYELFLASAEDVGAPPESVAEVHVNMGQIAVRQKDPAGARGHFNEALERRELSVASVNLALLTLSEGQAAPKEKGGKGLMNLVSWAVWVGRRRACLPPFALVVALVALVGRRRHRRGHRGGRNWSAGAVRASRSPSPTSPSTGRRHIVAGLARWPRPLASPAAARRHATPQTLPTGQLRGGHRALQEGACGKRRCVKAPRPWTRPPLLPGHLSAVGRSPLAARRSPLARLCPRRTHTGPTHPPALSGDTRSEEMAAKILADAEQALNSYVLQELVENDKTFPQPRGTMDR